MNICLVLMILTRLLTTLAHLYSLVGWLKMYSPLPLDLKMTEGLFCIDAWSTERHLSEAKGSLRHTAASLAMLE